MLALPAAELATLAELLRNNINPGSLTLEGMDGLFCALIASPQRMLPHQYLPVIWGGVLPDENAFASQKDANARMSLIMRYWNSIVTNFERESFHLPHIIEPGIDGIPGRAWARGFMLGTRLAPEGWDGLWREEKKGHVVAIPLVAGVIDRAWPKEPLTEERKEELLKWMIAGAGRAYAYFAAARRVSAQEDGNPETFVRAEPKVGRNEPCPCGSGKKYKRCCGLA